MKKWILVFGLVLSFNVYADCESQTNICVYDCAKNTSDKCTATLDKSIGTLTIRGYGEMKDYRRPCNPYCKNSADWQNEADYIQKIVFENESEDLTFKSVGNGAFSDLHALTEVVLPQGLEKIGGTAFVSTPNLAKLNLPESLKVIHGYALSNTGMKEIFVPEGTQLYGIHTVASRKLEKLIIAGDTQLNKEMLYYSPNNDMSPFLEAIYCESKNISCMNLITDSEIGDKIISYTKDSGVYILDGQMYASPIDMANTQNACVDMDTCKAKVLKNKGYCSSDEACAAMVEAENANHPIEYNNKSYASIDDLLKGKYMPKRIYTIDEANQVAGKTNSFKIRYR